MQAMNAKLAGCVLAGCLAALPVVAQDADEPTPSQARARELLFGMAEFLAAQQAYSVEVLGGYDVVQEDGQKIEFLESRRIEMARPHHLRVQDRTGAAHAQSLLFDGEKMTVWSETAGIFAQAVQPDTVDDGILYFVRDLQMRLPLAALLANWFPDEIGKRLLQIDYVEQNELFGQTAHHLAARTVDLDFQVWVADGDAPLPLRVVITYREEGLPAYRAQFGNWNLAPKFSADTFVFASAEHLRQVPFAIQVPPHVPEPIADEAGGQP